MLGTLNYPLRRACLEVHTYTHGRRSRRKTPHKTTFVAVHILPHGALSEVGFIMTECWF